MQFRFHSRFPSRTTEQQITTDRVHSTLKEIQQRGQQSFSWEEKKEKALEKTRNLYRIRLDFFFPFGKENSTNKTKRKQSCAHVIIKKKGDFFFSPFVLPIVLRFERAAPVIISTHPFCFWVIETRNLFGDYIVVRWIKFQNRRLCIIITKSSMRNV